MIGDYWTKVKLERLESFLPFFIEATCERYKTRYIDAFAGTGRVRLRQPNGSSLGGFFPPPNPIIDGSARRALRLDRPFDRYYLVEIREAKCRRLERLRDDFPDRADRIRVHCGDANAFLRRFCRWADWHSLRAVLFLDPPGTKVSWSTVEAIAETKAADLWYLFPLGLAVNRLLKRYGEIGDTQKNTLRDRVFGDTDWETEFYRPLRGQGFFPKPNATAKAAGFKIITDYFVRRLKTVFPYVAEKPLALYNRRGNPMFALCFASADPEGNARLDIARAILSIPSTAYQFPVRLRELLSNREA